MSGASLTSSSWYRVADLRPRLRPHARLHRMRYRGQVWYLLQDPASNRVHRFTPSARVLIAAMDGQRTVAQLWEMANRQLGELAPTQDEVIQLLGTLHEADLLQSDVTPDAAEAFDRGERHARATTRRSYMNPLSIRLHLWDPDALLNRCRPLVDALFGRWGGWLWLAVVVPALVLLPQHWDALGHNFSDRVLAVDNLLLLWLIFPVIKLLHELGHAAAVKRGGGEVHDMGIMLLVALPVPYVEATASTVFKSKYERALVGAAGMAVELFIAALAFYLWMLVEPSVFRSALFNIMLVAGVSTLVFNGNPLLRYDAYYMLSDLIEMPNLAQQATRYWAYLIERYAFGVKDAQTPDDTAVEKAWLAFYGLTSAIYRIFVSISIALFIAGQFFFIGVVLALWAVAAMVVMPLVKAVKHLAGSPSLGAQRRRAIGVSAAFVLVLLVTLTAVPVHLRTMSEGVVWLPESAMVRSPEDSFVTDLLVPSGSRVRAGEALMRMRQPELEAAWRVAQAKVAELEALYGAQYVSDRVQAGITRAQWLAEQQTLDTLSRRMQALEVRAASAGIFVLPRAADMPGRFVGRGTVMAYVIDRPTPLARVVVPQESVDLVRQSTAQVEVRHAHRPEVSLVGHIVREVPAGDEYLPSKALAAEGGGTLAVDPRDPKGVKTLERTFQFDVALAGGSGPGTNLFFGERVHVRFEHAAEPLAFQWYRGIRRLFLSHFHV
ncbi:MAG TPA: hypothetical protein VFW84_00840 [Aquabacterium sp.]|uniref:hypothetical protein n=1 Tax=Aquabacterium sp. TaxID=1872578 RepID=UPI002E32A457|nr:hypothetical protein [Aquabacterium sp.]HEX5371257.1 hypothetical protein [Aquabacterium sp.]